MSLYELWHVLMYHFLVIVAGPNGPDPEIGLVFNSALRSYGGLASKLPPKLLGPEKSQSQATASMG